MRYFEINVTGDLFINAQTKEKCEEYLRGIIQEHGWYNVTATITEMPESHTLQQLQDIAEEYEPVWKETKTQLTKEAK
jgi:hypothetical protein